ncbi:helix-turn-helix transcriptional regulator [Acetobacterium wieringae]|jgi:CBS domain-containing protein|uniref:Helix-turn-helix transcriptional regulator n=1 Tax=Acetobacterium wieringae TaxID=52694 RepID=A0A1F2PIY5_9FIRM|nr:MULTISPECIES: helix-turn-helix transcriptional regulator [Acetobacterium]HAZ05598.1 CBS domain-containing protein [Acetobacterium sp.]MEA4805353.1 helix-turn-helix transcriptional regulator [Acetobacterium wieringae]OFV71298.1 transcriptional repressor CcpN [Acetobacterium wieringae]TYC82239.1 helix-turn-helix transcriptional regulator [Acetobacterium wieringae]URN83364.1 helix-turn-helix transcriptional regulator [Acetobacterium wieringae]
MELSNRQKEIIEIVKEKQPVKSNEISELLNINRATIRPDLKILTMMGILEAKRKVGYYYTGRSLLHILGSYIKTINVMDIQTEPTVVEETSSIYDGIITMFTKNAGTLYVVDGKYLSGIVSRKDFIKAMIGRKEVESLPIPMIMTRMPNIIYLEPTESVYDAAYKTMFYEVESLPIVTKEIDEKGVQRLVLIGKVSRTNITRYVVNMGKSVEE